MSFEVFDRVVLVDARLVKIVFDVFDRDAYTLLENPDTFVKIVLDVLDKDA
jgi:hypothetical protein